MDRIHSSIYMSRHEDAPLHSTAFQMPFSLPILHVDFPSHCIEHDFLSVQFAFKPRQVEVFKHLIVSVMDGILRPRQDDVPVHFTFSLACIVKSLQLEVPLHSTLLHFP